MQTIIVLITVAMLAGLVVPRTDCSCDPTSGNCPVVRVDR